MARARTTANEGVGWQLDRTLPWILLIGGIVVMLASILLSIEVFNRLKNPNFIPICNLNPVLSCTTVADSPQSHPFGFPNYFMGIGAYAALATIGLAMLAGARFKRWFWQIVQAGLTFAFLFMGWLQFQTLYRIGALCLFCMVLWIFTWPMFWYTTLYNLKQGNISLPSGFKGVVAFCQKHHADILVSWYVLILLLILKRFWYYWSTLV